MIMRLLCGLKQPDEACQLTNEPDMIPWDDDPIFQTFGHVLIVICVELCSTMRFLAGSAQCILSGMLFDCGGWELCVFQAFCT